MNDPIGTPVNLSQFPKTEVTTTPPAFNKGANLAYWGNMPALYSENATSWPEWMHFIEGWAQDVFLQLVTGLSDTQDNLNTSVENLNKTLDNWHTNINNILNDWQKIIDSIPDKIRQDVIEISAPIIQEQIDLYVKDKLPDYVALLFNQEISNYFNSVSFMPETFSNLAALQAAYPNGKNGLFVTADNGHKYIYSNGAWTDAGIYQAVGIADSSIDPIKLRSTVININKSGGNFPIIAGNKDLYIINEPIVAAGVVNLVGKFSPGTINFYLLKKYSNKFTVLEKVQKTVVDGWQIIDVNFFSEGTGDEYIGVLGDKVSNPGASIYYNYNGGQGFYNVSSAVIESTEFITSQLIANSYFSLFTTIEDSELATIMNKRLDKIETEIPINQFKDGIKDFSKYKVKSANSTYIPNESLKAGNIIAHVNASVAQSGVVYIVKKTDATGLNFKIMRKVPTYFNVGENIVDLNYKTAGTGDEYIATTGTIQYSYNGAFGFYQPSSGVTMGNEGDVFAADNHTDGPSDFAIYAEYQSDLNKKVNQMSIDLDNTKSKLLLTDYTMPKYEEISGPVGFVGRWFDKTIGGVATKTTINQGSEFYFKVKNTTTINVNFVLNTALKTPVFAYSIDGAPMKRQLTTSPLLPTVTNGEHIIRIVVEALDEHEDKWNGEKGVSFRDVTVDNGGVVTGVLPKNRKIMFFGDSITEGIRVLNMNADPDGNSATGAFPYIASSKLNAISYRVGFGASGITTGGSGYVPKLITNIDKMTASRDTPYYEPDAVVINMGTNDGNSTSANFITGYNEVLDRLNVKYSGTPIFVILPFNGAKRSEILQVVSGRTSVYLIDTLGWGIDTTDGVHPNTAGSITAGTKVATAILDTIGKSYFES